MSIKRHGGKHYLAGKIIAKMPPHTRYAEPYAGGLSVLLAKPYEGISEFANDTDGELMNFWRVLANAEMFEEFKRVVDAIPLSERMFDNCEEIFTQPLPRAVAFFVRNRMSRQGLGKDYCTPTRRVRRGMNEQVSAWLSAVDGLPELHARLRRVELWNRPALKMIQDLDDEDTLFYLDPPYMAGTRSSGGEYGPNEMSDEDHEDLLKLIVGIKGKFMLSGYDSPLYQKYERKYFLSRHEFKISNNASSAKVKEVKTEIIWMNY